jgi:predicted amidophosphoribosyltransferase
VVYSVGTYEGDLRRAIVGYKYRGQRHRAHFLSGLLAAYLEDHATWFEEYDVLTPMPAYVGPGSRRSWDPVGRLVAELAERIGDSWAVDVALVEKTAETAPMRGLTQWQRARSAEHGLRGALRPRSCDLAGARILVVDDVFTEGSTLREVARVLRRAGADEVAGLMLARPALGTTGGRDPLGVRVGSPRVVSNR